MAEPSSRCGCNDNGAKTPVVLQRKSAILRRASSARGTGWGALMRTADQQSMPARLRVALFAANYHHIPDGVALTLNRLVAFLERRGVPVLVLAPASPAPAIESVGELVPVPSLPIPRRPEYRIPLGLPPAARARLAGFRPTLFHLVVPDLLGYRALRLSRRWGVPAVASYHTRFDTYLRFYGLGWLEGPGRRYLRHFYGGCRRVYAPSPSMVDILRAQGIGDSVRLWSRGVEHGLFAPDRRSLAWRRTQGIADDELVVTFVGRLVREKNTDLLLRIFAALCARGIACRTMVVGDGPEGAAMRARAPATLFTGTLHGEALARAYASSDIFVFPSESETFGNVTLEAMSAGLPTICAEASGSRCLVIENETGHLVPAGGPDRFVEAIAALAADPGRRAGMGQAARRRALQFDWDRILGGLLEDYAEVVAGHRQAPRQAAAAGPRHAVEATIRRAV
jgi:glycosyltransferase involved in cell wall biosynthesis